MHRQISEVPRDDMAPTPSPGQTQEAFIARVRKALTDRGKPVPLPDDLEIARMVGDSPPAQAAELPIGSAPQAGEDVSRRPPADRTVELFVQRVEQALMHIHKVADETAMVDVLMDLLIQAGAATVLIPEEDLPGRERILVRLAEHNIKLLDPDDPDAAFEADVGITAAALAVAETGSIVLTSGDDRRRLASLAVPCHIAMVHREQIVPDLLDWVDRMPPELPASELLVSGPSKTADIELALVVGVHGPGIEHIILIG